MKENNHASENAEEQETGLAAKFDGGQKKSRKERKKKYTILAALIMGTIIFFLLAISIYPPNGSRVIDQLSGSMKCTEACQEPKLDEELLSDISRKLGDLLAVFPIPKNDHKCDLAQTDEHTALESAKPGDIVVYGRYEQDNNQENGAEDIEWRVLERENDRLLMISRYALDSQAYDSVLKETTWQSCSIRRWLNSDFLEAAFSDEEIKRIPTVEVDVEKNPNYDTRVGTPTKDKVFLLSISELEKYFKSEADRKYAVTEYALARGCYVRDGHCWWWLRTPGCGPAYAAHVGYNGVLYDYGDQIEIDYFGVCPVIWIELN